MSHSDTAQRAKTLIKHLEQTATKPGAELSGLAFVAIEDGQIGFEYYTGRRRIVADNPSLDLPVEASTRFRVASISKPFVAIGCLRLMEAGLLDLEADVSDYLGWPLRNPAFPDAPISTAMLLSHTSSLRDGDCYSLPLTRSLREFFYPGSDAWEDGAHFDSKHAPGSYHEYCNLGFGVMGTVIERLSGLRFDLYMRRRVLEPMGVGGSFNVRLFNDAELDRLAAIYRKADNEDRWNPDGPWIPQVDDLRGQRPCANPPDSVIDAYIPGNNASWFSPQGGLRASAREVARLARLLIGRGEIDGTRLLRPESVEMMREARWVFDPVARNGDAYLGRDRRCGLSLFRTTNTSDQYGSDRLWERGDLRMEGHHGDAYGLLGGMLVDIEARKGFVYLTGGTAADPEPRRGRFSSYFIWQEEIQSAAADYLYL